MMPDLPTAGQAYRILLKEETHLQLSTSGGNINDYMACRVEKRNFQDKGSNIYNSTERFKSKRPNLWCDHCNMNGHIKEKCWKIIGYPPNHLANQKSNSWKRNSSKQYDFHLG